MTRWLMVLGLGGAIALAGCGGKGGDGGRSSEPARQQAAGDATARGDAANGAQENEGWEAAAQKALDRGVSYLMSQCKDGKWSVFPGDPSKGPDLGVSALAARAVLRAPGSREKHLEAVRPTLDWLAASQKPDGGIYEDKLAAYITAASILAFEAAGDRKYKPVVDKAVEYLRILQADEGEGLDESSEDYGGIGYGKTVGNVNNMSTTQWAVEAVSEAGLPKDDDFYRKALVFLQRSQNRSESNDKTHVLEDGTKVVPGNDGGGIYRPAESKAGTVTLPDGRTAFRSYGSMTYALLKSYLLCNLDVNDPRVRAALDWLSKNWALDHNPGMEHLPEPEAKLQGLYYYYLSIARTLDAARDRTITLGDSPLARWREELTRAFVARQRPDGSWSNEADRWFEGSPILVTAYGVMALAEAVAAR